MHESLLNCPLCGREVDGNVYGSNSDYSFEISCECGLSFVLDGFDDYHKAESGGAYAWNDRPQYMSKVTWHGQVTGTCACGALIVLGDAYCSNCGGQIFNPILSMKDQILSKHDAQEG